jgi:hypothetical protein
MLRGSSNRIRGGYNCVCFTEAPLPSLADGGVNPRAYARYSPFGILVSKTWLFAQGGRPVIYQTEAEFGSCDAHRWRHVRYEIGGDEIVDFTPEREWRIQTDALAFDQSCAVVVLPSSGWTRRLREYEDEKHQLFVERYSQVLDEDILEQYREPFWRFTALHE